MFITEAFGVNAQNHLTFAGCDTVELAGRFGTPLYVMNEEEIRKNCRIYKEAIDQYYGGRGLVLYASKAFSAKEIYRIVHSEGLGADAVSAGEIYTAVESGFPAENICFHGNNKTDEELQLAVDLGVGRIVADNVYELERLNRFAKAAGKTMNILFRIKPGIDAHTHSFIMTGQIDSKFGVALETGEAMDFVAACLKYEHLRLVGVHCHIGSQIFELEPFEKAAAVMVGFMADVKDKYGVELQELNLGGGFGIKYTTKDKPVPFGQYIEAVSKVVTKACRARGLALPFILMEPGRSIVAEAGITLYTVGSVKHIPGVRTYVSVDGGMCDNPRYILYEAEYEACCANKAGDEKSAVVTIAGKCCESGDLIARDAPLQTPDVGDTMAVFSTGAYNYSMASNYNRLQKPAVVMLSGGEPRVIVRRETLEDLVKNDV